jgi:hypothetical protein
VRLQRNTSDIESPRATSRPWSWGSFRSAVETTRDTVERPRGLIHTMLIRCRLVVLTRRRIKT